MKKLNILGKIFLSIFFVLPFLLNFGSVILIKAYFAAFVPALFICFILYCIWFDREKENESKLKRFFITFLQLVTCFFWLSNMMVYGLVLLSK